MNLDDLVTMAGKVLFLTFVVALIPLTLVWAWSLFRLYVPKKEPK